MNKHRWKRIAHVAGVFVAVLLLPALSLSREEPHTTDSELLRVREQVWRAWFAGDTKTLEKLVPPETIVISDGEEKWKNRADVIRTSAEFHEKGGRLIRLEFPHTEVQHFGEVAIVWSSYVLETESGGKRSSSAGRATETFVWHKGRWTNPGWLRVRQSKERLAEQSFWMLAIERVNHLTIWLHCLFAPTAESPQTMMVITIRGDPGRNSSMPIGLFRAFRLVHSDSAFPAVPGEGLTTQRHKFCPLGR